MPTPVCRRCAVPLNLLISFPIFIFFLPFLSHYLAVIRRDSKLSEKFSHPYYTQSAKRGMPECPPLKAVISAVVFYRGTFSPSSFLILLYVETTIILNLFIHSSELNLAPTGRHSRQNFGAPVVNRTATDAY
jgi:hypothetical protein